MVIAKIPLPEIKSLEIIKERFNLKRADWKGLNEKLNSTDWSPLRQGTANDAARFFMETLWISLCAFIPYEKIKFQKKSHPWINSRCEEAIRRKNAAEGTPQFQAMQQQCTSALAEEYHQYLKKLKEKITSLKKGSKQWWKLNRELLERKTKCSSIAPLRDGQEWVNDPKCKANLFATTFASKSALPPEMVDCPFFGHPDVSLEDDFIALRTRYTLKIM